MNYFEIASTISEILGRPITYQPITIDEYRQELEQLSVSPFRVQHLCAVALDCQDGIFAGTDAIIEGVTGKPPMTVQAFVASRCKNRASLRSVRIRAASIIASAEH
jgi:uncharacterized protein YbjT (DUF2867 family)